MKQITTTFKPAMLRVPGAEIYYEVRGSGPTLLLMPGGPADATTFRKMENDLARSYTVITYDPRGLSHSKLTAPLDDARMVQVFADDARRLLKEVAGDGKPYIFASSGGASIVLELLARHGDELEAVIAHEPPTPALLANPAEMRAGMEKVSDTFASDGLWPAVQKFTKLIGIEGGPPPADQGEPTPEQREAQALMQSNMNFFFGRYVRSIARYEPDFASLTACSARIVAGIGEDSKGQLAHNGGVGLAAKLGSEPVVFPGAHGGFDEKPREFAVKIREVFAAG